jgi:hypothetical protein
MLRHHKGGSLMGLLFSPASTFSIVLKMVMYYTSI